LGNLQAQNSSNHKLLLHINCRCYRWRRDSRVVSIAGSCARGCGFENHGQWWNCKYLSRI